MKAEAIRLRNEAALVRLVAVVCKDPASVIRLTEHAEDCDRQAGRFEAGIIKAH